MALDSAVVFAAGIEAATDVPKCVICLADLNDGAEVSALACCHSFHSYCLQTYATTTSTSMSDVRCPVCKTTSEELGRIDLTSPRPDLSPPASWLGGQGSDAWQGEGSFDNLTPFSQLTEADVEAALASPADALASAAQPEAPAEEAAPAKALAVAPPKTAALSTLEPLHKGPTAGTHCPWSTPPVYCSTCGNYASFEKCRVLSKREGTWRCSQCRVKMTQLYRGFGSWPTAEFDALSAKEKQEFFQETSANGLEVVNQAKKILERTEEKEDYYDDQGSFLPLSVWVSQGYDGTSIVANTPAKNQKTHPVLGLVYRVSILTTGNRGAKGTKESDVIGSRPKRSRRASGSGSAQATPTEPAQAVKEEQAEKEDAPRHDQFGSVFEFVLVLNVCEEEDAAKEACQEEET